jgi:hypothetical protein
VTFAARRRLADAIVELKRILERRINHELAIIYPDLPTD